VFVIVTVSHAMCCCVCQCDGVSRRVLLCLQADGEGHRGEAASQVRADRPHGPQRHSGCTAGKACVLILSEKND